jgi:hypothetical protein
METFTKQKFSTLEVSRFYHHYKQQQQQQQQQQPAWHMTRCHNIRGLFTASFLTHDDLLTNYSNGYSFYSSLYVR